MTVENPENPAEESAPSPYKVKVPGLSKVYDRRLILTVLMISLAMGLLQISTVNVALETLRKSLGASPSQIQWVLSGFALAVGIVLVPAGRLGDMFGRKLMFIIGLAAFGITSAACGLAPDPTTLNLLRIVQGISVGLFSPQTTGIIQQFFEGQARAKAYAVMGLVISASVAAGPVMTGFLIQTLGPATGWRWSFAVNLPLGIIGAIAAVYWLPTRGKRTAAQRQAAKRRIDLDHLGMLLLAGSVLCVMLPFILKGHWYLLLASVALLVVWIWWEARYKVRGGTPMVDLDLFRLESFSFGTAVVAIQFLGQTTTFALFAIWLQEGFQVSAFTVGLLGLPNAVATGVASLIAGNYALRYGRGIQVGALAGIITGIGLAIGTAWMVYHGASPWWMAASLAVMGLGQGFMGAANTTQSMLDVPPAEGGTAGGVQQTVQRIATAIGNTLLTALYFAVAGAATTGTEVDTFASTLALCEVYGVAIGCIFIALLVALVFWLRGRSKAVPNA